MVTKLYCEENKWFWHLPDEPKTVYFTDERGEGIFKQKTTRETNYANECDVHQLTGTCQFSLAGYSLSGARKKLNRYYFDE